MNRKLLAFSMTLAMLLSLISVANVGAHTVTIEKGTTVPSRTDWFATQPDTAQGAVMRNKAQQGEFIFNDATKSDLRSISASSAITREADLDWFGITADANNIYFLAKVENYCCITNNPSIELMITIDTDHVSSAVPAKTQLPLADATVAQTNVPGDAAWEYVVDTKFSAGASGVKFVTGSTNIWSNSGGTQTSNGCNSTTCPSQLAAAGISQGSFAEIAVPWTSIAGAKPTGANFLRFTVATLHNPRAIPTDGYNSPVIDVLGNGKTLADIQDGTMNTSFDVHFDTNPAPVNATYEPYAPLLISEFQPNPVGDDSPGPTNTSTDSEWIEIYNPNTFAVNLNDYKVGNAAKSGSSSQGMFRFKSGASIGAKATVIVAKFKTRFLAGHPGFPNSQVYDISSDLTKYSAWANGDTISLDNGPSTGATTFEEQVLLLDLKDDIVDLVNYGTPTVPTPGNIPIFSSSVAEGVSFERCPAGLDTNGGFDRLSPATNNTDFITRASTAAQTPGIACVGTPGVNMKLVKTASATNATPGEEVVFTLSYNNVGSNNDPAGTATVTDTLPSGLTFVSAVPAPTTVSGKNLTWNVAAPNAGGLPTTIEVTAMIDAGLGQNEALVNNAGITSPNEPADAATRSNNFGQATVTTIGPALLSLNFSGLGGNTPPGTTFEFELNYGNTGQDDATDTTITLNVPANVTILSANAPDASANFTTPIVGPTSITWSIANLVSGTGGTISFQGQVAQGAVNGSTLTFSAQAASLTASPNTVTASGDNSQTVAFNKIYMPMIIK